MPFEADAYVGGVDCGGNVLSVSADSDMSMYNTSLWLQPSDWTTGHSHMVDFASFSTEDAQRLPLVAPYRKHGKTAIPYAAAIAGCDMVQADKAKGLGWEKILPALNAVTPKLTPRKVAAHLKEEYPGVTRKMNSSPPAGNAGLRTVVGSVSGAGVGEPVRLRVGEPEPGGNNHAGEMPDGGTEVLGEGMVRATSCEGQAKSGAVRARVGRWGTGSVSGGVESWTP